MRDESDKPRRPRKQAQRKSKERFRSPAEMGVLSWPGEMEQLGSAEKKSKRLLSPMHTLTSPSSVPATPASIDSLSSELTVPDETDSLTNSSCHEPRCAFCNCGSEMAQILGSITQYQSSSDFSALKYAELTKEKLGEDRGNSASDPEGEMSLSGGKRPSGSKQAQGKRRRKKAADEKPLSLSPDMITFGTELRQDPLDVFDGQGLVWAHHCCAAWSAGVCQTDSYDLENVDKAALKALVTKCSHCNRYGASTECQIQKCTKIFHYPCCASSGAFQDIKSMTLLCAEHQDHAERLAGTEAYCVLCNEVGDLSSQLFCTSCGRHYHGSCLHPSVEVSAIVRMGWQCPECKVCQGCRLRHGIDPAAFNKRKCQQPGDDDKMLFCDVCDKGFHIYCLNPPMSVVPKTGWKCVGCRKCEDCGSNVPGGGPTCRWHFNYTVCDRCYQQRKKGQSCPVCGKAVRQIAGDTVIQCKKCTKLVHIDCDEVAEVDDKSYTCPICNRMKGELDSEEAYPSTNEPLNRDDLPLHRYPPPVSSYDSFFLEDNGLRTLSAAEAEAISRTATGFLPREGAHFMPREPSPLLGQQDMDELGLKSIGINFDEVMMETDLTNALDDSLLSDLDDMKSEMVDPLEASQVAQLTPGADPFLSGLDQSPSTRVSASLESPNRAVAQKGKKKPSPFRGRGRSPGTPGRGRRTKNVERRSGKPGRPGRPRTKSVSWPIGANKENIQVSSITPSESLPADELDETEGLHSTVVVVSNKDQFSISQDICMCCGSFGKGTEGYLITCAQCGQCFHPFCVNVKVNKVIMTKGWRCLDCTVCEGCGKNTDEGKLLLCDNCDISYHIYCLDPPLKTVPPGGWKCQLCVECTMCGARTPGFESDWMSNYSLCGPCASETSCPICSKTYLDDDLTMYCENCHRWLHAECDGLMSEDDAERATQFGYHCCLCRPVTGRHGVFNAGLTESSPDSLYGHTSMKASTTNLVNPGGLASSKVGSIAARRTKTLHNLKQNMAKFGTPPERTPLQCVQNSISELGTVDVTLPGMKMKPSKDDVLEHENSILTDAGLKQIKSLIVRAPLRINRNKDKGLKLDIAEEIRTQEGEVKTAGQITDTKSPGVDYADGRQPICAPGFDGSAALCPVPSSPSPSAKRNPKASRKPKLPSNVINPIDFFGSSLLNKKKPPQSGEDTQSSEDEGKKGQPPIPTATPPPTKKKPSGKDKKAKGLFSPRSGPGPSPSTESWSGKLEAGSAAMVGKSPTQSRSIYCGIREGEAANPSQPQGSVPVAGHPEQHKEVNSAGGQKLKVHAGHAGHFPPGSELTPTGELDLMGFQELPHVESHVVEEIFAGIEREMSMDGTQTSNGRSPMPSSVGEFQGDNVAFKREKTTGGLKTGFPAYSQPHNSTSNVSVPTTASPEFTSPHSSLANQTFNAHPNAYQTNRLTFNHTFGQDNGVPTTEGGTPMGETDPFKAVFGEEPEVKPKSRDGASSPKIDSQKQLKKWEQDEKLGEFATISPVLYANLMHLTLKNEYPEWPNRARAIARLWRKLPAEQREPFRLRARDNRVKQKDQGRRVGPYKNLPTPLHDQTAGTIDHPAGTEMPNKSTAVGPVVVSGLNTPVTSESILDSASLFSPASVSSVLNDSSFQSLNPTFSVAPGFISPQGHQEFHPETDEQHLPHPILSPQGGQQLRDAPFHEIPAQRATVPGLELSRLQAASSSLDLSLHHDGIPQSPNLDPRLSSSHMVEAASSSHHQLFPFPLNSSEPQLDNVPMTKNARGKSKSSREEKEKEKEKKRRKNAIAQEKERQWRILQQQRLLEQQQRPQQGQGTSTTGNLQNPDMPSDDTVPDVSIETSGSSSSGANKDLELLASLSSQDCEEYNSTHSGHEGPTDAVPSVISTDQGNNPQNQDNASSRAAGSNCSSGSGGRLDSRKAFDQLSLLVQEANRATVYSNSEVVMSSGHLSYSNDHNVQYSRGVNETTRTTFSASSSEIQSLPTTEIDRLSEHPNPGQERDITGRQNPMPLHHTSVESRAQNSVVTFPGSNSPSSKAQNEQPDFSQELPDPSSISHSVPKEGSVASDGSKEMHESTVVPVDPPPKSRTKESKSRKKAADDQPTQIPVNTLPGGLLGGATQVSTDQGFLSQMPQQQQQAFLFQQQQFMAAQQQYIQWQLQQQQAPEVFPGTSQTYSFTDKDLPEVDSEEQHQERIRYLFRQRQLQKQQMIQMQQSMQTQQMMLQQQQQQQAPGSGISNIYAGMDPVQQQQMLQQQQQRLQEVFQQQLVLEYSRRLQQRGELGQGAISYDKVLAELSQQYGYPHQMANTPMMQLVHQRFPWRGTAPGFANSLGNFTGNAQQLMQFGSMPPGLDAEKAKELSTQELYSLQLQQQQQLLMQQMALGNMLSGHGASPAPSGSRKSSVSSTQEKTKEATTRKGRDSAQSSPHCGGTPQGVEQMSELKNMDIAVSESCMPVSGPQISSSKGDNFGSSLYDSVTRHETGSGNTSVDSNDGSAEPKVDGPKRNMLAYKESALHLSSPSGPQGNAGRGPCEGTTVKQTSRRQKGASRKSSPQLSSSSVIVNGPVGAAHDKNSEASSRVDVECTAGKSPRASESHHNRGVGQDAIQNNLLDPFHPPSDNSARSINDVLSVEVTSGEDRGVPSSKYSETGDETAPTKIGDCGGPRGCGTPPGVPGTASSGGCGGPRGCGTPPPLREKADGRKDGPSGTRTVQNESIGDCGNPQGCGTPPLSPRVGNHADDERTTDCGLPMADPSSRGVCDGPHGCGTPPLSPAGGHCGGPSGCGTPPGSPGMSSGRNGNCGGPRGCGTPPGSPQAIGSTGSCGGPRGCGTPPRSPRLVSSIGSCGGPRGCGTPPGSPRAVGSIGTCDGPHGCGTPPRSPRGVGSIGSCGGPHGCGTPPGSPRLVSSNGSCGGPHGCGTPPGSPEAVGSVGTCGGPRGCGTPPGSPEAVGSVGTCGGPRGCGTPPGSPQAVGSIGTCGGPRGCGTPPELSQGIGSRGNTEEPCVYGPLPSVEGEELCHGPIGCDTPPGSLRGVLGENCEEFMGCGTPLKSPCDTSAGDFGAPISCDLPPEPPIRLACRVNSGDSRGCGTTLCPESVSGRGDVSSRASPPKSAEGLSTGDCKKLDMFGTSSVVNKGISTSGNCGGPRGCGTPPLSPRDRKSGDCGKPSGCNTPPESPEVINKSGDCGGPGGCGTPPGSPAGGNTGSCGGPTGCGTPPCSPRNKGNKDCGRPEGCNTPPGSPREESDVQSNFTQGLGFLQSSSTDSRQRLSSVGVNRPGVPGPSRDRKVLRRVQGSRKATTENGDSPNLSNLNPGVNSSKPVAFCKMTSQVKPCGKPEGCGTPPSSPSGGESYSDGQSGYFQQGGCGRPEGCGTPPQSPTLHTVDNNPQDNCSILGPAATSSGDTDTGRLSENAEYPNSSLAGGAGIFGRCGKAEGCGTPPNFTEQDSSVCSEFVKLRGCITDSGDRNSIPENNVSAQDCHGAPTFANEADRTIPTGGKSVLLGQVVDSMEPCIGGKASKRGGRNKRSSKGSSSTKKGTDTQDQAAYPMLTPRMAGLTGTTSVQKPLKHQNNYVRRTTNDTSPTKPHEFLVNKEQCRAPRPSKRPGLQSPSGTNEQGNSDMSPSNGEHPQTRKCTPEEVNLQILQGATQSKAITVKEEESYDLHEKERLPDGVTSIRTVSDFNHIFHEEGGKRDPYPGSADAAREGKELRFPLRGQEAAGIFAFDVENHQFEEEIVGGSYHQDKMVSGTTYGKASREPSNGQRFSENDLASQSAVLSEMQVRHSDLSIGQVLEQHGNFGNPFPDNRGESQEILVESRSDLSRSQDDGVYLSSHHYWNQLHPESQQPRNQSLDSTVPPVKKKRAPAKKRATSKKRDEKKMQEGYVATPPATENKEDVRCVGLNVGQMNLHLDEAKAAEIGRLAKERLFGFVDSSRAFTDEQAKAVAYMAHHSRFDVNRKAKAKEEEKALTSDAESAAAQEGMKTSVAYPKEEKPELKQTNTELQTGEQYAHLFTNTSYSHIGSAATSKAQEPSLSSDTTTVVALSPLAAAKQDKSHSAGEVDSTEQVVEASARGTGQTPLPTVLPFEEKQDTPAITKRADDIVSPKPSKSRSRSSQQKAASVIPMSQQYQQVFLHQHQVLIMQYQQYQYQLQAQFQQLSQQQMSPQQQFLLQQQYHQQMLLLQQQFIQQQAELQRMASAGMQFSEQQLTSMYQQQLLSQQAYQQWVGSLAPEQQMQLQSRMQANLQQVQQSMAAMFQGMARAEEEMEPKKKTKQRRSRKSKGAAADSPKPPATALSSTPNNMQPTSSPQASTGVQDHAIPASSTVSGSSVYPPSTQEIKGPDGRPIVIPANQPLQGEAVGVGKSPESQRPAQIVTGQVGGALPSQPQGKEERYRMYQVPQDPMLSRSFRQAQMASVIPEVDRGENVPVGSVGVSRPLQPDFPPPNYVQSEARLGQISASHSQMVPRSMPSAMYKMMDDSHGGLSKSDGSSEIIIQEQNTALHESRLSDRNGDLINTSTARENFMQLIEENTKASQNGQQSSYVYSAGHSRILTTPQEDNGSGRQDRYGQQSHGFPLSQQGHPMAFSRGQPSVVTSSSDISESHRPGAPPGKEPGEYETIASKGNSVATTGRYGNIGKGHHQGRLPQYTYETTTVLARGGPADQVIMRTGASDAASSLQYGNAVEQQRPDFDSQAYRMPPSEAYQRRGSLLSPPTSMLMEGLGHSKTTYAESLQSPSLTSPVDSQSAAALGITAVNSHYAVVQESYAGQTQDQNKAAHPFDPMQLLTDSASGMAPQTGSDDVGGLKTVAPSKTSRGKKKDKGTDDARDSAQKRSREEQRKLRLEKRAERREQKKGKLKPKPRNEVPPQATLEDHSVKLPLCEPEVHLLYPLVQPYGSGYSNGDTVLLGAFGNALVQGTADYYSQFPSPDPPVTSSNPPTPPSSLPPSPGTINQSLHESLNIKPINSPYDESGVPLKRTRDSFFPGSGLRGSASPRSIPHGSSEKSFDSPMQHLEEQDEKVPITLTLSSNGQKSGKSTAAAAAAVAAVSDILGVPEPKVLHVSSDRQSNSIAKNPEGFSLYEKSDLDLLEQPSYSKEESPSLNELEKHGTFCRHCGIVIVGGGFMRTGGDRKSVVSSDATVYGTCNIQDPGEVFCSQLCLHRYFQDKETMHGFSSIVNDEANQSGPMRSLPLESTGESSEGHPFGVDDGQRDQQAPDPPIGAFSHVKRRNIDSLEKGFTKKSKTVTWRRWKVTLNTKKGKRQLSDQEVAELLEKYGVILKPEKGVVDKRECLLCCEKGDGQSEGTSRLLNYDVDTWIHLNCALWSLEVYETLNGALHNVQQACERGRQTLCSHCGKKGATIGCARKVGSQRTKCDMNYHFGCAIRASCCFFKDKTVLCPQHKAFGSSDQYLPSYAVYRKVYVDRDLTEQLAKVLRLNTEKDCKDYKIRVGSLIFHDVGQLLPHQMNLFHSRTAIFPVGFSTTRIYFQRNSLMKRSRYECFVGERDGKPEFFVSCFDNGKKVELVAGNPTDVWRQILGPVRKLREENFLIKMFPEFLTGEDLFGLTDPSIQRIIESMPGADTITDYNFRFGRNPTLMAELPLAINPSGCMRSEPNRRPHLNRPISLRTASHAFEIPYELLVDEGQSGQPKSLAINKTSQYKRLKTEWKNNVLLGRSRIQGLGLFARRDVEPNTFVIEYIGSIIRNELANNRERIYEMQNRGIYMFRIDTDRVIDATLTGGPARYINHSCNPNCVAEVVTIERDPKIIIISNRKIDKGEELTYDYKFEFEDDQNKIACLCGAPNCRKWMN